MTERQPLLTWMTDNGELMLSTFPELAADFNDICRRIAYAPCSGCMAERLGNRMIMLAAMAVAARPRPLPETVTAALGRPFRMELSRASRQSGGR